jgi:hypothetical protein
MSDFVIGLANANGLYGIFEDYEDTGYLYLSDHGGEGIIDHLHIYDYPEKLGVDEKDIEVVWSKDQTKCGVKIWGKFYGIFDLEASKKTSILVKDKNTAPINDPALLEGF